MSQRFVQLQARTQSVSQLGTVIAAMRSMAAGRAQESRARLANVLTYAQTVAHAISQVLAMSPAPEEVPARAGGQAVLLFCAEHGFAGAFSERIFEQLVPTPEPPTLLVVGTRGVRVARARGLSLAWSAPMVAQLVNSDALANRIGGVLFDLLRAGRITGVDIVHAQAKAAQGYEVVRHPLLPLDYQRFAPAGASLAPLLNLAPQLLLEQLAGEYLFAQLNEAIVASFAAENLARLETMSSARENTAHRLEGLQQEVRQARQEEITAEIVELAAGAQALAPDLGE
jgi:F-type H+-transporting ATPase subunit gamma